MRLVRPKFWYKATRGVECMAISAADENLTRRPDRTDHGFAGAAGLFAGNGESYPEKEGGRGTVGYEASKAGGYGGACRISATCGECMARPMFAEKWAPSSIGFSRAKWFCFDIL